MTSTDTISSDAPSTPSAEQSSDSTLGSALPKSSESAPQAATPHAAAEALLTSPAQDTFDIATTRKTLLLEGLDALDQSTEPPLNLVAHAAAAEHRHSRRRWRLARQHSRPQSRWHAVRDH